MLPQCKTCLCALQAHESDQCTECSMDLSCHWCRKDTPWRRKIPEYILSNEYIKINLEDQKYIGFWSI